MRIYELILWSNDPIEGNHADPTLSPINNDPTNLATAFTKDGRVKHFWNLIGSEEQPYGPAPPGAETEVIPRGTLEPTTASWDAEHVEGEPVAGQQRLVPFQQYPREIRRRTSPTL